MAIGNCLLTGATGTFVRSHLTPQAFTAPAFPGAFFTTAGSRARPTRTFTSWYDKKIVTRKGEDILAELDSYAVDTLRSHKLVWSGWDGKNSLDSGLHNLFTDTQGIRTVIFDDPQKTRLFCLSILWRWAVSTLPAASEINIAIEHQHKLRDMILASDGGDPGFFPVSFIQLSTRGEAQNMAPIASFKDIYHFESETKTSVPFYRFYLDGLIMHFGLPADDSALGELVLSAEQRHTFPTIKYEGSSQLNNLNHIKRDVEHEFPQEFRKLF